MTKVDARHLRDCVARYRKRIPQLEAVAVSMETATPAELVGLYDRCFPLLERALWSGDGDFDAMLEVYQALFREQDALIRAREEAGEAADERHHFILSIPVADRPAHLRACLESIHRLCECFGYGGRSNGRYSRIQVLIAEDSREPESVRQHRALAEEYRRKGLQVFHFGLDEQYELLQSIPVNERRELAHILGTPPKERFYLKGQAVNRNLSYLKCLQLSADRARTLYYMVDSDESFCVSRQTGAGEQVVHALNYFYYIDRVFRTSDTRILTGKMVGDPPVSPAVMAANFLDDITAFFTMLADTRAGQACRFHAPAPDATAGSRQDAAYHDMAGLFGFESPRQVFPYHCELAGEHDNAACLRELAGRLAAFFFGEHLTRKTWFGWQGAFDDRTPARTLYPGNYVANYEGLRYVIPFGHLRLRMSGPTAGRLIAAEIGERFASVNLPHLHRRTAGGDLHGAFRPGVELDREAQREIIDLSNEFERQFFGDLMLFTTETLVREADVHRPFEKDCITAIMERKERELLQLYQHKRDAIGEKTRALETLVFQDGHWWLDRPELADALSRVRSFLDNVRRNFGEHSPAWEQIRSAEHRDERKRQITEALMHYRSGREAWERLIY